LHREPGYRRFFFVRVPLGMIVASLAGDRGLFIGWELVGLSSALLVAFSTASGAVINGQRVWSVYRFADAAFLIAPSHCII
jgi:NAD(P)H-quinone oxidoreductase subunit 5